MSSPNPGTGAQPAPGVKDVARIAGVSVGTVSNVLNRPDSVSPNTRDRVMEAISRLGYVRNATATALRTGKRPLVGVAVLDISNPFFMSAARGMERRLQNDDCVMILSSTHSDVSEESRLLHTLASQAVRGLLLTPTDPELKAAHEMLERGLPVVLFDTPSHSADMSSISVDDRTGAAQALTHLIDLGHRHIAVFIGPRSIRQATDRLEGARRAVSDSTHPINLTVYDLPGFTMADGREGVTRLLSDFRVTSGHSGNKPLPSEFPTAVFCGNDLLALSVMTSLDQMGIRIPQQVSVVGFDDIPMASQMMVPLTTVRQPMEELGWQAADMLLTSPDSIRHQKFAPKLVVRASTTEPR